MLGRIFMQMLSLNPSFLGVQNIYKKWIEIFFNIVLVLSCQSAATLLGELYYKEGGKTTWLVSLLQNGGFPLLLPIYFLNKIPKKCTLISDDENNTSSAISIWKLLSVYVFLGTLLGGCCMLSAVGLLYLPVSTFSLINTTQLGFNTLFSFFLNSKKITTYIANSIFLLTISSILLVLQRDDSSSGHNKGGKHYIIGFICKLFASAGYALLLSFTERVFRNIIKKRTMKEVINLVIWQSFFATCVILIGLFASGGWKGLKTEMQEYKLGKLSYVMTLVWNALCWQVYTIVVLSLITKVSALFANVITALTIPLIPILAVIIFHEKMSGMKAVSMILAIWGFLSYAYQQYLDELKRKADMSKANEESEVSLVEQA
ncbi:purine permease 21-like [Nicotiana tabacum]|uniref:Probable purine permease n=1 Tax=Nicotiana tabacum TaxID=4097 RepID=A0A1S4BZW9_TOBAC|nr:PREDICTED: probable purine permease 9 [Nicotiana tabacum]